MRTFFFLSTKPQLSQAGALLLPKDFVSLSISKVIWDQRKNLRDSYITHKF